MESKVCKVQVEKEGAYGSMVALFGRLGKVLMMLALSILQRLVPDMQCYQRHSVHPRCTTVMNRSCLLSLSDDLLLYLIDQIWLQEAVRLIRTCKKLYLLQQQSKLPQRLKLFREYSVLSINSAWNIPANTWSPSKNPKHIECWREIPHAATILCQVLDNPRLAGYFNYVRFGSAGCYFVSRYYQMSDNDDNGCRSYLKAIKAITWINDITRETLMRYIGYWRQRVVANALLLGSCPSIKHVSFANRSAMAAMAGCFGGKMNRLSRWPSAENLSVRSLQGIETIECNATWEGGLDSSIDDHRFLLWTMLLPSMRHLRCAKLNAILPPTEKNFVTRTKLQSVAFEQCDIEIGFLAMIIETSPELECLCIERPYDQASGASNKDFNTFMHQLKRAAPVFLLRGSSRWNGMLEHTRSSCSARKPRPDLEQIHMLGKEQGAQGRDGALHSQCTRTKERRVESRWVMSS